MDAPDLWHLLRANANTKCPQMIRNELHHHITYASRATGSKINQEKKFPRRKNSMHIMLFLLNILTLMCTPIRVGGFSQVSQINATVINSRELVRHKGDHHQYELGNNQQHYHHQPPSIPAHYVKLGNNTKSMARNMISSQHLRTSSNIASNQSMTTSSDLPRIDENHSSLRKGLYEKICIGTSNRMSGQSNKTDHYQTLIDRYRNCTYVIGNLELTWLERGKTPMDLTFLESIREITGYLLIAYVDIERISMPNLQIIRGRELFKLSTKSQYALFAFQNKIQSLEMPNLREIIIGNVGFYNNSNLCHIRTIEWGEILNDSYNSTYQIDGTVPEPNCPACHSSCRDSCWGPGPDMCQKFSKLFCSPQCEKGRCFGSAPRECCHPFCAGGCTGPKQSDCLACKYFNNDGECIQECPSMQKYNPSKFSWEPDPNGKYAFGATCVRECPANLLRDNGACVRSCPLNKKEVQGECVPCSGPCPKDCQGGLDECISCNNYRIDDYCVNNCSSTESILGFLSYEDPNQARTCKRCHSECRDGCTGPEAAHCKRCRNVQDGKNCVHECPSNKYNRNGTCEDCDKSCGPDSCTGPLNRLGEGGCNSCAKAIIKPVSGQMASSSPMAYSVAIVDAMSSQQQQPSTSVSPSYEIECIRIEEPCPDGYYQEYVLSSTQDGIKSTNGGRPVCRKCHPRCKRCIGMGTHRTVCECAKYASGEQCEDFCPRDYYADEKTSQCVKCSPECNGCFGPTESDCLSCRFYRIYYEDSSAQPLSVAASLQQQDLSATGNQSSLAQQARMRFNCTAHCPADKPHRIIESNMLDPYCSEDPGSSHDHIESSLMVSLGSSAMLLMLLVISAALMVCLSVYRFQQEKAKKFKLTMHLSGIEDVEPLTPSHMKPNLAPLRSIKETELRKGRPLGSGFGGTVYQGFWYPEGQEQHGPRPVAIKVLRDNGQSNMNKEFLDEAYIMASVNHPNLVRLLAVCMTPTHLMLVTQLMPLGCLLDYVKKNRRDIGSKNLLEWGKQVARGMAYLEENRMVHRDLALRNVLLQTPGRALISDFGLAKFLEKDQSEYQSGEGRLPIKWLAPECFRKRKFTHKSDVWAFGVTIWELVTFGQRPFEEYETKDVPLAIEKGARLQQPGHVSAEVYKVMYACWFYKPEERPNFKQLTQSFVNFARDPERFIICGTKGIELCKVGGEDNRRLDAFQTEMIGDDDDEEEFALANSDNDEDSTPPDEAANEHSPTTTTSFSQQATPTTLMHQPELTPSTHNRINEIFGFDLRREHHHNQRLSESSNGVDQAILKKLADEELFAHQQHLLNHHHSHHHHHHQVATFQRAPSGPKAIPITLIDANNNNTLMVSANNRGQKISNRPKNSVNSCWSMHHTVSSSSLGQRSEQPLDVYDYLLPSPCTDGHGNAFEPFYSSGDFDQNSKTLPRSMDASRAHVMNYPGNQPLSAGIIDVNVTNEEYFLTRANYVNNQVGNSADYHHQGPHQLQRDQRLSTSSGDIPQSLV